MPRLLSFIQAEEHLARRNVEAPQFSTFFTALDRAYDAAREAMVPEETDLLILQWFLFCHRSLLGAASMIAHGAPDDTAAITRRATKFWEDRVKERPSMMKFPDNLPIQGRVPLMYQGECVGAIGVSGVQSHEDEQIANAGVAVLG